MEDMEATEEEAAMSQEKVYIVTVEKLVGSGLRGGGGALARTEPVRPGSKTRGSWRLSRGQRRKGGGMLVLWTFP